MARTNNSQRRIQTRQAATISTLGAAHTMFISARWFLLCGAAINHAIESRTLSSKYFVSYYDRGQNMLRMIYASDVARVVTTRMDIYTFTKLCKILENRGGLSNSKNMLVDEQVAMFLHTLAHNEKNRNIGIMFKRSGETICRYFKLVLNAVCRVHKEFYKEPVPIPDDEIDERWKWFKGCLGALDGTYVKVRVPASDRKPYRSRKGEICTNVLGVCTRDLQFTYVLAGWEGSAADSRVLRDAISRPNGLKVPHGNYYLCDAGYMNCEGFLSPYRGQRYHLNDWNHPLTTAKELYNMRHAQARNVIERCFGLIKNRWAILRDVSYHPPDSMARIIIACCLINNYIRATMAEDPIDHEVPSNHTQPINDHDNVITTVETSQVWSDDRDNLANTMFTEWNERRAHLV